MSPHEPGAINITTVAGFALSGFSVGLVLCGYTFYLTSHERTGDPFLFLVLCPPSMGAMALDNAGLIGGIIGWIMISFMNAGWYGFWGFLFAMANRKSN